MSPWSQGFVDVPGGRIAYHRTGGDLPPLVLSHGLTDNGLCWSRTTQALADDFDVIMLDARGHGLSSRVVPGQSAEPGQDIAATISLLGLKRPHVMGHSMGALATAACAAAHPDLVSKVILEDPPLVPVPDAAALVARRARLQKQVDWYLSRTEAEIIAVGRKNSPLWHTDEFPAWAQSKRQMDPGAVPDLPAPWQDLIARLSSPTLLIHGEQDLGGMVTPDIAAEAIAINPNVSAVQIRGAGHNVRRENFADYMAAVRGFLGVG